MSFVDVQLRRLQTRLDPSRRFFVAFCWVDKAAALERRPFEALWKKKKMKDFKRLVKLDVDSWCLEACAKQSIWDEALSEMFHA